MRIALISDTHNYLPPSFIKKVKKFDEIWHAGDIGHHKLLTSIAQTTIVRAVHGNIDTPDSRFLFPSTLFFIKYGWRIFITHHPGKRPFYTKLIKEAIKKYSFDILVTGHTHIPHIAKEKLYGHPFLHLNPGALGKEGFHEKRTYLVFSLEEKKQIKDMAWVVESK